MFVLVDRKWKKDTYTIGRVYIDGEFFANSLEDKDRGLTQDMSEKEIKAKKVYGETAIPTGEYIVKMTYSPRFKRQMPQILDVKCFSGIRVHSANDAKELEGCQAYGKNTKPGKVTNSRATVKEFERRLNAAGGWCKLKIV